MSDFQIGDHVDANGQHAIVRFVGETSFAPGEWLGVELDVREGKNNGTVQGQRYFECEDRYGIFLRPSIARLMERPAVAPMRRPPPVISPPPPNTRIGGRPLSLRAPASPTKGISPTNASSSGYNTPRTGTPTMSRPGSNLRGSINGRPGSMGPPPNPNKPPATTNMGMPRRQSTVNSAALSRTGSNSSSASNSTSRPPQANRLSLKPASLSALGAVGKKASAVSTSSERSSPEGSSTATAGGALRRTRNDNDPRVPLGPGRRASVIGRTGGAPPARVGVTGQPLSPGNPGPAAAPNSGAMAALSRELEDLKSTIKVMEKKRMEDRDKLRSLERVQAERNKFETIIQKLQAKYQPQQVELTDLRKQLKEIRGTIEEMENIKQDNELMVEMATLDREMAEEQTEALRAELEAVRGKAEELEMEVEILREENAELSGEMTQEEKTSAGWLQMEKQNERLREALLRLREITSQTETELKDTIKSLEEENTELAIYKENFETVKGKLNASEAAVEDLRQQLEMAESAEQMLEDLTERNLAMSEQVEELKATVEDLESLKEISDELEINHVETEKQMQEELDYKDLIITEQIRRIGQLDSSNEEAEYTITRFRDLVTNLQSDLEDMRASQQITETEAEELTQRSRSMMDINMKLQITAAKAQNKTIDLELRRLEADQAIEQLAIVQMFLPEAFHSERDSILALLRFKRVSFKAQLLQNFVKERLTSQLGQATCGQEDTVMAACDMCDKLTWVSAMCDRFINCISGCSVAQFSKFQGALYELDPVERALNGWIEGLRKDDLKEKQCVSELQRTMALMSHLGEIHLQSDLEGFASDIHMRVILMQSYMENSATALSHIRTIVQDKLPGTPEEDEEVASNFSKRSDAVISHSRSAKVVVGKILRSLNDFQQRSLSLTQDKLSQFEACEEATKKLADYAREVGDDVYTLLYSDNTSGVPTWVDLQSTLFKTTERVLRVAESDIFGAFGKELRALTNILVELGSTAADIDMTAEFEKPPAPWVVRAQELKTTKVVSIDAEEEIRRLKDDILGRATQIKLRDKILEESAVKIELLESRMRNVTKQSERIEELEMQVSAGTVREAAFSEALSSLNEDVVTLEAEVDEWKKAANEKRAVGEVDKIGAERAVATAKEVDSLKKEITALTGAVAFFREENSRIKNADLLAADSWLLQPLLSRPDVKEVEEYETDLAAEGQDVFAELMLLATESKVVDLTQTPENRKAWRPARSTPKYHFLEQREHYESLVSWRDDVISRALYHDAAKASIRPRKSKGTKSVFGARVNVLADHGLVGKGGEVAEVVIHEPEGWEEFQEAMGFS
ncbi:dynein associated protein-domain-containing protein [Tuber brumale]|nr:dynein associated protein-domain-containing protein [Tuber brumale]